MWFLREEIRSTVIENYWLQKTNVDGFCGIYPCTFSTNSIQAKYDNKMKFVDNLFKSSLKHENLTTLTRNTIWCIIVFQNTNKNNTIIYLI